MGDVLEFVGRPLSTLKVIDRHDEAIEIYQRDDLLWTWRRLKVKPGWSQDVSKRELLQEAPKAWRQLGLATESALQSNPGAAMLVVNTTPPTPTEKEAHD